MITYWILRDIWHGIVIYCSYHARDSYKVSTRSESLGPYWSKDEAKEMLEFWGIRQ